MVPMIGTGNNSPDNSCTHGAYIAKNFTNIFANDGYVISPGAAIVCKESEESFIRGMTRSLN